MVRSEKIWSLAKLALDSKQAKLNRGVSLSSPRANISLTFHCSLKRSASLSFVGLLLVVLLLPVFSRGDSLQSRRQLSVRQRLEAAKSYYLYAGKGHVALLSKYDVVILHAPGWFPVGMSVADVQRLNGLGVVTLGYLSIGQTSHLMRGDGKGPGGYASWYLTMPGARKPEADKQWHSYYTNCCSRAWRKYFLRKAAWMINKRGFEGLFLDCVNTYDRFPHKGLRACTAGLIHELRKRFPNAPIVLNEGTRILPTVAPWINGLMLESFTLGHNDTHSKYIVMPPRDLNWRLQQVHRITPLARRFHLKLFALDYALPTQTRRIQMAANRAATLGLLEAVEPVDFGTIYPAVVGHFQGKWLRPVH